MTRVVVVCAAGASSTFLARRLSDLATAAGLDWTVAPSPVGTIHADKADIVAVTSHVATPEVLDSLTSQGIRFVVLPGAVRGGFGVEDALSAIVSFVREDGGRNDSNFESPILEETH